MADIKITERLLSVDTYKKYAGYVVISIGVVLIIMGFFAVWRFLFPKPASNIHKPTAIVTPFAKVEKIDQSSQQVLVEEKPWEVSVGGGVLRYDNKDGFIGGLMVRRKF
jgi:hypothetical protein